MDDSRMLCAVARSSLFLLPISLFPSLFLSVAAFVTLVFIRIGPAQRATTTTFGVIGTSTPPHSNDHREEEREAATTTTATWTGRQVKHERKRIEAAAALTLGAPQLDELWTQWSASSPSYLCDKILQIIGLTDQSDRKNDTTTTGRRRRQRHQLVAWRKEAEAEGIGI